ncbi:MAG: Dam family site-specific DNA-(adenine-N6)-methyltransferase, partial [Treponema sp.]|nr:Dam family site-specific DNA-(adenine-N6)-methyltransferase [Treponema sp.]
GGKRQLLPEIKKHLPGDIQSRAYYEPFIGAGAVFFDLRPGKAVISDANAQLMLTYEVIRENVEDLIALLKLHQDKNCEEYFYKIRNLDRDAGEFAALGRAEKAARLIFLNKTCFNGLYRVNSQGFFNVPYGKHNNPLICEEAALRQISRYLNEHEIGISSGDFENAVMTAGGSSFVYFDPPYHSPGSTGFTGYRADGFGEKEQERLRDVVVRMTDRGAKCLLSNADTEFIRRLYAHELFDIVPVQARRYINSDPAGRGSVGEVLIKNWKD